MPVPVFDADNHVYKTCEAFTKFRPDRSKKGIQYAGVNGRTDVAIRGRVNSTSPNPTFDVGEWSGAHESDEDRPGGALSK
jgi:hypothetical protein